MRQDESKRRDQPMLRDHRAETTILLLEGERISPEALRQRLLDEGGYRLLSADSLESAVALLDREPVELVILGPSPAGGSFEHALATLSADPASPDVLVAGGPDNPGVATWALRAGASAYLTVAELEGSRPLRSVAEILAQRHRSARVLEESRAVAGRMESIERLFEVVSGAEISVQEQLQRILRLGCELFRLPVGIVSSIFGSRYEILQVQAPEELSLHPGMEFDLGLTYCSITLARSEPVTIDEMAQSEWKTHPCYAEQGLESYIGARIDLGDGEVGTLNFSSPLPRSAAFRSADRDLMRMMSTWVSTVLIRERLHTSLEASEALYRDLVENSSDLICTHDLEGIILSANRILLETFGGGDESEVLGHSLGEFLVGSVQYDLPSYLETIRQRGRARGYMRVRDRRGEERILEYHNSLRSEGVDQPVVRATARDVTDLKRAEADLRHSEEMLRVFVKHTPAAVAMFDREMCYLAVSDRWRVDYRLGGMELLGRSHYEIFPEIKEHWREVHRRCLEGGVEQADEDPFPRADGHLDWVRWEVRPWYSTQGDIGGLLMFTELVTDRKRVEEALRYLATHDHLTGLPNRTAFLERLDRSLERAAKDARYGFSLFFLDLNDFKTVNDTWGHGAGDDLLQQVADRLRGQLRPKDALARFAGDELVGLLEDTSRPDEARAAAERLLRQLDAPFDLKGHPHAMSASLGIVLSRDARSAEQLLSCADTAMYAAKESERGGWHLFGDPEPVAPSSESTDGTADAGSPGDGRPGLSS